MSIDEAIEHAREIVNCCKNEISTFPNPEPYEVYCNGELEKCAYEHEQLAEWLEELKELRTYKEKMEMQYLDDIDNPLEPLKLQCALESEIFKYNYRKEHKPKDINLLDFTVMYALKHCLEEQLKGE